MSDTAAETLSVVVERDVPFAPGKVWRALTQPHLIAEWLMKNDFSLEEGRSFNLSAEWGSVTCRVRTVEPERTLSYTWQTKDLDSVVTWTLTPSEGGTTLRMEQVGFRADQQPYWRGAQAGWPRFFASLEQVLAGME